MVVRTMEEEDEEEDKRGKNTKNMNGMYLKEVLLLHLPLASPFLPGATREKK